MDIDLHVLRRAVALAEHRRFVRSQIVHVPESAISRNIQKLDRVGTLLLDL